MSTRYNKGSHYENHPQESELRDGAAHSHRVAEQHGKQEHLSGHEQSRKEAEHNTEAHEQATPTVGHGIAAFGHHDIEVLAYRLWEDRGSPYGSPDTDWHHAVEELRSRSFSH